MRTKEDLMKEIGTINASAFPRHASANEYLFLEVLADIRDQQKKDAELLRDTLKLVCNSIDRTRGI